MAISARVHRARPVPVVRSRPVQTGDRPCQSSRDSARPDRGFHRQPLVNKTGEGFFLDIALGIVGAVAGAGCSACSACRGQQGLNIYSLIVARNRPLWFLGDSTMRSDCHCVIPTPDVYTTGWSTRHDATGHRMGAHAVARDTRAGVGGALKKPEGGS